MEVTSYIRCANTNKMLLYSQVKLIQEMEKRPGLWSSENQGNRDEKLAMWKEVGAAMFKDWSECSKATAYDRVLQLQRKWRSLRDAYRREIRMRLAGKKGKATYKYFKIMSFLGGYDGPFDDDHEDDGEQDTKDSTTMEIEKLDENFVYDDDPLEQLTEPKRVAKKQKRKAKKRRHSSEEVADCDFKDREEIEIYGYDTSEREHVTEDSDKLFLMSFLPELKGLPLHLKMWVRSQIANTMQEAVSRHYNETTSAHPHTMTTIKMQREDSSD
ncbi:hypothetical protein O0L34_g14939 [Tuta absoluta]|nr:hypothetical protein O0L34_g14939 [Tuta absoluta]